ncbi:MAG: hypothetical protein CVV03_08600 [Firmicutes bacterium HGW-Firmicutes-8]|nr:MAG: hypothetical protein CVV03_08600 [Firmicutes bacterium HGW-Firmicutes-8]
MTACFLHFTDYLLLEVYFTNIIISTGSWKKIQPEKNNVKINNTTIMWQRGKLIADIRQIPEYSNNGFVYIRSLK